MKNLEDKSFSQSINRSYYSMFHAVRALKEQPIMTAHRDVSILYQ
jgi:uncharacterized protein (UPF0332 family)